ncbi:MAG TPA: Flp pilus assembly protein CpaB [Bryobacteraceae bacterium]|nr:Flp pilus assembly protein CpaB [Bryobacteraceae bacterium]
MNKRLLSVLGFALVISAIASIVLYRLISTKLVDTAKPATGQVAVASHDLEIGTLIKDADVKIVDWSGPQPKGVVLKPADVVGRGVIAAIYEGEPILDSRLAPRGAGAGLAATIPVGMRAVAVRVNDIVGVAGFVVPGMRVDVLIAGNPPNAPPSLGTQTKTLLQNIEVLSAGQNIQKDAEGKPVSVPVVNLLLTPEQAEIISLASNETRIQLILRNPLDNDTVKTPGTAVANLFTGNRGLPEPPKPGSNAPPKPRIKPVATTPKPVAPVQVQEGSKVVIPLTVEVFTGASRAETKFQPEEAKHQ